MDPLRLREIFLALNLLDLAVLFTPRCPHALFRRGFAVLLVLSPFQGYLGSLVGSIRSTMVRITDERARTMNEVLSGIKVRAALAPPSLARVSRKTLYPEIVQVVKLFGWEAAMASRVAEVRGREIAQIRAGACVRVANTVVAAVTPVLVTLATFITYTLGAGGVLTATQVRFRCGWNTCVRSFSLVAGTGV